MPLRMSQPMVQLPIVGQQDEAGRVLVEATHRRQIARLQLARDQIEDRPIRRIARRRKPPRGLVHHQHDPAERDHRLAVERYAVRDVARRIFDELAVDGHTFASHELLCVGAADIEGVGEEAVQTGRRHGFGLCVMEPDLSSDTLADGLEPGCPRAPKSSTGARGGCETAWTKRPRTSPPRKTARRRTQAARARPQTLARQPRR